VLIVSGKDGKVLRSMIVPDGRETYYSPVVYKRRDGSDVVLFGTGGETHSGSLFAIALDDLYRGDVQKVLCVDIVRNLDNLNVECFGPQWLCCHVSIISMPIV